MKELAEKCSCLSSATLCAAFQEWNIFITSAPMLGTNIMKHRFGPTLGEDVKLMEDLFVSFLVRAARVQWAAPPALRSLNPKQLAFVSYIKNLLSLPRAKTRRDPARRKTEPTNFLDCFLGYVHNRSLCAVSWACFPFVDLLQILDFVLNILHHKISTWLA